MVAARRTRREELRGKKLTAPKEAGAQTEPGVVGGLGPRALWEVSPGRGQRADPRPWGRAAGSALGEGVPRVLSEGWAGRWSQDRTPMCPDMTPGGQCWASRWRGCWRRHVSPPPPNPGSLQLLGQGETGQVALHPSQGRDHSLRPADTWPGRACPRAASAGSSPAGLHHRPGHAGAQES